MIELRTLGSLDLRGPEGQELRSILSQPRRLALLAYLAVATPRGFHRRDTLLGLFWPEQDEASARHALNQALYALRQSLGERVLLSRGAHEVGLSWEVFWCDVKAFDDAVESEDPEIALELYRGDLLEGFFASGAPEFEKWLEGAGVRLREQAAGAAWAVAHQRIEAEQLIDAVQTAQRALALVPTNESEVQRFVQALAGAGDRAAAVRFYERFAQGLRDELGLRPAAASRDLVEKIRASMEVPVDGRPTPGAPESEPEKVPGSRFAPGPSQEQASRETESTAQLRRLRAALADRYGIEREIGRGGMATVYLAQDLKHERQVALKVMRPEVSAILGRDRFLREIRIAAKLNHPHILALFDSGEADGLLFFVMPYVEGGTLQARIEQEGPLPINEALRIAREVADAMAYAHEHGVIHRDIKPSNILFEAAHALIADFGLARAVGVTGVSEATATGIAVGTPRYMSPEQARAGEVDGRADVYGLGCVLWEMLAGEAPFDASTPQALLAAKLSDTTPSLRAHYRSIPPEVEGVIAKAMAPLAADRYGTARELKLALSEPETPAGGRSRRRRRTRTRSLAGVTIAAFLGVAAWWMFGRGTFLKGGGPYALAVLPPENLTGEEEHFVAGQHQALIDQLATIAGFRVISRPSVLRYRDTEMTVPEIADELGVRSIVASSLARHGDTVLIRVQLIEADPEESLLWTGSFKEAIPGLYAMYGDAARSIAGGAEVRLSPAEETRLGGEGPIDPATYEAYLRGMHHLYKNTPEDIAQGLVYLHEATDRSPADAMAWAGLSLGYSALGHGPLTTPEVWTRARAAAERAVRLDSTLAEAWSALADVRFYADWDWEGAELAFRRANEVNPNIAMNHFHYAWLLLVLGRYEEAVVEHELAKELDPFTPFQSALLGWCYLHGGETERAEEEARRTLELNPDEMFGLFVLGAAQQAAGRHEEAIATHERMGALYPFLRWLTATTYARVGRVEDARRMAAEIEAGEITPLGAFGLAVLYGALGDVEATHRWLTHEPNHVWRVAVAIDPIVGIPRDVLGDPRFEGLMDRLNLPGLRE